MKNLKLILIILVIFLLVPSVNAKNINTEDLNFRMMQFNETENSVTYRYILDYANMLYNKINADILFKENWYMEYRYKLHADGTISDLKPMPLNTPYKGKTINKLFEKLLKDTTPPPFPNNMEIGDVYIELQANSFVSDKIIIHFLRYNEGAPIKGNHIDIYIPVKNCQKIFKFYR